MILPSGCVPVHLGEVFAGGQLLGQFPRLGSWCAVTK